ncbi:MAG TPA: hypothetical protein VG097_02550 [Gemmata sp.]|jgi:hypothetical protein|nr:hypothetical protein [Gemmata sp.]
MRKRFPKLLLITVVAMGLGLTAGLMPAQQQQPPAQQAADANNGMEVLSRGPVHEAYADTHAESSSTPAVTKMPPDGIEELPPDHKPDGNNVQWIPGYWHWDEDRKDFTWISGFWRSVPPGRVWVPGSWRGVPDAQQNSWQWVPGVWQEAPAQQAIQGQQAQHEVQYLSEPPKTLEVGPQSTAPTATSFYSPGGWVWRGGRYAWQPGYWMEYRAGWVWVPPHYRWSPIGYIYVEGYWDYPLATRGVMYAPVGYTNAVYLQPGYVYTPTYVVSDQCMMGAMFVRRGWGCYYFGDYYGPAYATGGYSAWCGTTGPNGVFVVGYGAGPRWGYDPLWGYYSVAYRGSPGWRDGMGTLYVGRFNGTIAPPPVTLVQQNIYINRVTNVTVVNVTNSYTVVGGSITVGNVNVSGMAMVAPTRIVVDMHPEMRIQPLPMAARREEVVAARQMREAAAQRMRAENALVARGDRIPRAGQAPHTTKLEVPRAAIARAQIDEKKAPPPNPHKTAAAVDHAATNHVEPKAEHTTGQTTPKVDPKGPNAPKVDPKGPTTPKIDPKGPTTPNKNDPKRDQKNEKP